MYFYEIHADDGREWVVSDVPIDDLTARVEETCRAMATGPLTGSRVHGDWLINVVEEFCRRNNCRRVAGPSADAEDIRDRELRDRR